MVVLCAGTGGSQILSALKSCGVNLTAIVNVTDNGGSSRDIRESFAMPQPGDARKCMEALCEKSVLRERQDLQDLFAYRFERGRFKGVSMGNMILAAFHELSLKKQLSEGVARASRMLSLSGKVVPVTDASRQICARYVDGQTLCGEWEIISRAPRVKIERVFLDMTASATNEAVAAIQKAEIILIAPGSLYTGIIPLFLMRGIKGALKKSRAKKIWVANVLSQPGLTDGMTIADHIHEIEKYSGVFLNVAIINSMPVPLMFLRHYQKFHAQVLAEGVIPARVNVMRVPCIEARPSSSARKELARGAHFEKWRSWCHLLRHDSKKLRYIFNRVLK